MDERPERLWGVTETAGFLGIPAATLYQWRYRGYGPRGRRVGRYLRYDPGDVWSWFTAQEATDGRRPG